MAETQTAERPETGTSEGNGDHGKGRTVARAAAIAAATGATALAAKRALSDRGSTQGNGTDGAKKQRKSGDSVMSSVLSSSWDSARDSVVPMLEEAASSAGEFVARNAPDIVSETIVPEFIRGFERGRKSSDDDE